MIAVIHCRHADCFIGPPPGSAMAWPSCDPIFADGTHLEMCFLAEDLSIYRNEVVHKTPEMKAQTIPTAYKEEQ